MDISGINGSSAGLASSTAGANTKISSDFETFLRMLTVQMENQDPLNPVDSSDYAVQLATFSSVEQQVLTNDLLRALGGQIGTTGMAQMAAWVGKEARAPVAAYFDGDPITIAPNPAAIADRVDLVVYDSNGMEVQRKSIPTSADPIQWNGNDDNGDPLPDGKYTFRIESFSNGEQLLDEVADVYSRVTEVRSEGGETILILSGGVGVLASAVSALRDPELI